VRYERKSTSEYTRPTLTNVLMKETLHVKVGSLLIFHIYKGSCRARFIAPIVASSEERRLGPFAESDNKIKKYFLSPRYSIRYPPY
jgi:hypothetical protein